MTGGSVTLRALLGRVAAVAFGVALFRHWQVRWGATDAEVGADLPGDELMLRADRSTTRAMTIAASPKDVWPWLAQMGQGRGGLYSYDVLENLIGCDIHSADQIEEEWQHVTVGDSFRLHPDIALHVVAVETDHALVIQGGIPMGDIAPPYDFTWAFVLNELTDGTTRLIIRERYTFTRWWASLVVDSVTPVSGAFTRGAHTVTARLIFNDAHELIDFISDDRTAASSNGKRFVHQRWSTPLRAYRSFGATRIATIGEGRWHAPDPEGEYTYIDFHIDDIVYNATPNHASRPRDDLTASDGAYGDAASEPSQRQNA
jgi:hypothetical protein